jgi:hypothetical protein
MDDAAQNQQPLQGNLQQAQGLASYMPQASDGMRDDQVTTVVAQGGLGVAQPSLPTPPEPISVPNKEVGPTTTNAEAAPLVELREDEKIPEEVQGWVEKLQKEDISLPKPIQANGEVVLAEPSVKFVDDKIVLPLTQQGFTQSAQAKVTQSIRWLHEWCKRVILMQGEEKTKFRD